PDTPAWRSLNQRAGELLDDHGESWLAPIAGLIAGHEYRRGLLDDVCVEAGTFCRHADLLLRTAPTARWIILAEGWSGVRDLVRCEHFPRLRRLRLSGGLGGAGARILAESRGAAGLIELGVAGCCLGQPGVQALAMSAYLRKVRVLDLSDNNLSRSSVP